jgi:hypothetical protein
MTTVSTRLDPLCKRLVSTTSDLQRTWSVIIELYKNAPPRFSQIQHNLAEDGLKVFATDPSVFVFLLKSTRSDFEPITYKDDGILKKTDALDFMTYYLN